MWKYTVQVSGMMCGMCESHVNDAVRKAFPVKKVTSSRSRNETTVIAETELDEAALGAAISATGYDVGEIRKEPWRRRAVRPVRSRDTDRMERGQNFAGGISGSARELDADNARRPGLPVLPARGAAFLASPAGAPPLRDPVLPGRVNGSDPAGRLDPDGRPPAGAAPHRPLRRSRSQRGRPSGGRPGGGGRRNRPGELKHHLYPAGRFDPGHRAGAAVDGRPGRLCCGGPHGLEPGGLCPPGPPAFRRTGPLVRVEVGGAALPTLRPGEGGGQIRPRRWSGRSPGRWRRPAGIWRNTWTSP